MIFLSIFSDDNLKFKMIYISRFLEIKTLSKLSYLFTDNIQYFITASQLNYKKIKFNTFKPLLEQYKGDDWKALINLENQINTKQNVNYSIYKIPQQTDADYINMYIYRWHTSKKPRLSTGERTTIYFRQSQLIKILNGGLIVGNYENGSNKLHLEDYIININGRTKLNVINPLSIEDIYTLHISYNKKNIKNFISNRYKSLN